MHRFLHDHIAHVGQEKAGDALFLAVFQNPVAAFAVHARHKHRVVARQQGLQLMEAAVILQLLRDFIQPFGGLSAQIPQPAPVLFGAVNQDGFLCGEQLEVQSVAPAGPGDVQRTVQRQHGQEPERRFPHVPGSGDDAIDNENRKELGQQL